VAIRNKQTQQQQEVIEVNEVNTIRDEDCIIEDFENDLRDAEAAAEYQTAVGPPSQIMQEDDEDSESEDVTVGHNMITIVADVHSQDESNIYAANQLNVAENLNPVQPQVSSITILAEVDSQDESNLQAANQLDITENLDPAQPQSSSITITAEEVHSDDEINVQAANQLDIAENLNPLPVQSKSSTFLMALWKSTR